MSVSSPSDAFATAMAQPSERPRKVLFLHVLKTGGMTFRRILSSIYGESFHVCDDPSIESITASLARFDCLEFHALPWRGDFALMHRELVRSARWDLLQGADLFTMVREPVDQVVSLYFHLVRKRAYVEPAYKANNVAFPESLEEFIDSPWHFNNQLAFLAGNYQLATKSKLTQEDLAGVKEFFVRLPVHVGLTERYSESLHVFETVTGHRIPGEIEIRNRNVNRPLVEDIPVSLKRRIRDRSVLDIELYEFARELLAGEIARCGPAPRYSFSSVRPV